jgi:hypothetical protein
MWCSLNLQKLLQLQQKPVRFRGGVFGTPPADQNRNVPRDNTGLPVGERSCENKFENEKRISIAGMRIEQPRAGDVRFPRGFLETTIGSTRGSI